MATMVRIDEKTHSLLKRAARSEGVTMQELLKRALEEHRRQRILEKANAAYSAVRDNASEYRAMKQERESLDGTLSDGLENEA